MSASDRYRETVRHALNKDGWTITDDPLTQEFDERTLYAEFGAERLLPAERDTEKIAVKIKTFRSRPPVADLEQAIGKYSLYKDILQVLESERTLHLAIPEEAFAQIFPERIGQLALKNRIKRARLQSCQRGDHPMASVDHVRDSIARVFQSWENYPIPALSRFKIVGAQDVGHDRYTLTHVDFDGGRYKSHLLAYLEIRDGKIWIPTDNTEDGIAGELVAEVIAKDQIVLGFYSPGLREAGEFAVNRARSDHGYPYGNGFPAFRAAMSIFSVAMNRSSRFWSNGSVATFRAI